MKLNLGCGGNRLDGWENHDIDVDITKPLPFPDASAEFILAEHVVEHVTIHQAWRFFEECKRVLKPNGVLRVVVPDVSRIYNNFTPEYGNAVKAGGHGDGSKNSSVRAAIFEHGHQAAWTRDLLMVVLSSIGFSASAKIYGFSGFPELLGVEGHGKVVGESIAEIESSIVEGIKP